MATLVQSLTGTAANTTNPSTAAFGSATTVGNTIVAGFVTDASGAANHQTSVTGGGVTTFAKDTSQGNGGGPSISMDFWSGAVTSSATTALTIGFSTADATRIAWLVQEWSGLAGFDQASTIAFNNTGSVSPLSGSTGTLAQADNVVFGLVEWRTASVTPTAGSGYTGLITDGALASSALWGALESKIVSATTAQTAGFTLSTSEPWGCLCAVYKATAAGGPITRPVMGGMSPAVARSSTW